MDHLKFTAAHAVKGRELHYHAYPLSALGNVSGPPFAPAALSPRNQPSVLIKGEGGKAPEPVSTFLRRRHLLRSVLLTEYCAGGKIEKNGMGGACSIYGGVERGAKGSGGKT